MRFISGIAILGLVLSVAACGNNNSNAELVAKQQAEIEKLKADAELAKAQTAKLQAEADKAKADTDKLNDEARVRKASIDAEEEQAKGAAETRKRIIKAAKDGPKFDLE